MYGKRIGLVGAAALALCAHAHAQTGGGPSRGVLPIAASAFNGAIASAVGESQPATPFRVTAPANALNVFLFMSDDVGLAMASTLGGPVPTPNLDRIAQAGVRFNPFHTTGICPPSRAALPTGRAHHNVGFGHLADLPAGYPGYTAQIPPETAPLTKILKLNGYNTAMFGKSHNVRHADASVAGPFDQWPTRQGFEYFWGIIGGDSNQYEPANRGATRLPDVAEDAPMMEERLGSEAIDWVHNQQAVAPDKPFFLYYAPGSTHVPHQAPADWIARFAGMKAQGIIPANTQLTARPAEVVAWDGLSRARQRFAARSMEVAAAMLAYQDAQLGSVLGELERTGEKRNLLTIFVIGDNGASAESGNGGTLNELGKIDGLTEDEAWLTANLNRMGGPMTCQACPAGWAWAMNTPLRWTKQYASMLGGICNGIILRWNERAAAPGSVCARFGHLIDIAPTIIEAAQLPVPVPVPVPLSVNGVAQRPMDGKSLFSTLDACTPDHTSTQYFEMGGKTGLWHDSWFLAQDDGRTPWMLAPPADAPRDWQLYNLRKDYSQSCDVAAASPAKVAEMVTMWEREAEANHVYPLDRCFGSLRVADHRPQGRSQFDYWAMGVSVPALSGPVCARRSFNLSAEIAPASANASGVVVAYGSRFAGWSLYRDKDRPVITFAASSHPVDPVMICAKGRGDPGKPLVLRLKTPGPRQGATPSLRSGADTLASGSVRSTFLMPAGLGETLDLGRDIGVDVTACLGCEGTFAGEIPHVVITLDPPAARGEH